MTTTKDPRNSRQWRALRAAVLMNSDRCWLCGRIPCEAGCCRAANTGDHILPVATHPHLALDPDNVKPAHRCCNRLRGAGPPPIARDPTTRVW